MAAKKKSASKKKAISKTSYIRNLPHSMPAKDVVEKGRADGLKLSIAYIYGVRSKSKTGTKTPKKRGRPFGSKNSGKNMTPSTGAESALYNLIGQIVEQKVNEVLTARFGALLK